MENEIGIPNYTLCVLVDENAPQRVLLGTKLSGFGVGKITGFGGRVEPGETIKAAALREVWEECSVLIDPAYLHQVGELRFLFPDKPSWSQMVYLFLSSSWHDQPQPSDEMSPKWYLFDHIPFDKMWQDGAYWLPPILEGRYVRADFIFWQDGESILEAEMDVS